jgi:hypothetical protein
LTRLDTNIFSPMARKIAPPKNWKKTEIEVAVGRSDCGRRDIKPITG